MKFIAWMFTLFCLSGCTHLILDSTERLQLKNGADAAVAAFSVVGERDTIPWVRDTVLPGELSLVREKDFVGSFHIVFSAADSAGNWRIVDLGKVHFDGGSEILILLKKDGVWHSEFE